MPDLIDLLDRTTPTDLPPPDLPGLARRGRQRRARRRTAVTLAALVPVLAVGVAVVGRLTQGDPPETHLGAGAVELTAPVGAWSAGAPTPLGPRSGVFSGVLGDGRVLVWGGTPDGDAVTTEADGAIYDPEADTWEAIPEAPVPAIAAGGGSITSARLVDDRLAVVAGAIGAGGEVSAAVYDVAAGTWTAAPAQDELVDVYDAVAWDGTTLALVRVDPGHHLDDPAKVVDEPVTVRWTVGDQAWTTGAPPPLSLRFGAGDDADADGRLALWGGTGGVIPTGTTDPGTGADPGVLADGAVYDVTGDSWAAIAPGPLAGRIHPTLQWSGGRLLVGGGLDRLSDPAEQFADAAWYDPAAQAWEPVADAPVGGAQARGDHVIAQSMGGHSGPQPVWFLGPQGWEESPQYDLHTVDGLTVATTVGIGNPGDDDFAVVVRADRDVWLDAAAAPFTNRMDPVVAVSGTRLVVIGGLEGSDLDPTTDTWVLDLAG